MPFDPSSAAKYSVPFTSVSCHGAEVELPGRMSLTSTVPDDVPLLFHSSVPFDPLLARKYSVPFTFTRKLGEEEAAPE